jgi:hypothetical protein
MQLSKLPCQRELIMDMLVGLLVILLLLVVFRSIRRDTPETAEAMESSHNRPDTPTNMPSDNSNFLTILDGSVCIYADQLMIYKAQIVHADAHEDQADIRLRVLKTAGLDQSPDDVINISAPLKTLDHTNTFLHAPYVNWQLFLDKQLIDEVTDLAAKGEEPLAIKRILLDHRMETTS